MCREKGEKINVLAPGGVNSRSSSPNLITFLEWQLGQNQRPLQLNARRYSLRQSGFMHRTLAKPSLQ